MQAMDKIVVDSVPEKVAVPSLWSRCGPLLLLGAFAVFLFREASFYWPLTLTAFLGYAATRLFKLSGLILALIALVIIPIFALGQGSNVLWTCLLTGSIAVSLFLIYLGGKEAESLRLEQNEKVCSLDETIKKLEKQLLQAKATLSEESRRSLVEVQRLNTLHSESVLSLNQAKQSLVIVEQEQKHLIEKYATLTQEGIAHQNNGIALYHALEEAKTQIASLESALVSEQLKNIPPQPSIIQQDEPVEENPKIEFLQSQYTLLREQFDEKSEALHLTRKELFKVENDYLALQKACEEQAYNYSEEDLAWIKNIEIVEGECKDLEIQIESLQEFISALLNPKKRASVKKKKSDTLELPDLLQNKIDEQALIK